MSSSSDRNSNLFHISSESSRTHDPRPHHYSAFALKVRHLLDYPEDDLDQLYRKVEVIVRRYFEEHNIVEFREMYEHIACLKNNSRKINLVLDQLEHRLAPPGSQQAQMLIQRQKGLETSSTDHHPKFPESKAGLFEASNESVNTSIKYGYVFKPSFKSPNKHKKPKKKRSEMSWESPSKLNSSTDSDYQNRNHLYNEKIRQLEKEIELIKKRESESRETTHQVSNNNPSLTLPELKENEDRGSRLSQNTLIDICSEQNFIKSKKDPYKSATFSQNDTIKQGSDSSSTIKVEKGSQASLKEIKVESPQSKEGPSKAKTASELRKEKHMSLIEQTEKMTKEIHQIKEMASRLSVPQIREQSQNTIALKSRINEASVTSIVPQQHEIHQREVNTHQEFQKKPLLDQMENAVSKQQVTEHILPSNYDPTLLEQNKSSQERQPNHQHHQGQAMNRVNSEALYLPLGSNNSQLTNSYYIGTRQAIPQQQVDIVRYSYNPFCNHSVAAPPTAHQQAQDRPLANRSVSLGHSQPPPTFIPNNSSALTSNNSVTSIMHQPRHILPLKKTPMVQQVRPTQPFASMNRPYYHQPSTLTIAPPEVLRRKGITLTTQTS